MPSDTPIDKLSIEITASAAKASKGIKSLSTTLEKLKAIAGTVDFDNLAASLKKIDDAISNITSDSVSKLKDLASALKTLQSIKVPKGSVGELAQQVFEAGTHFEEATEKIEEGVQACVALVPVMKQLALPPGNNSELPSGLPQLNIEQFREDTDQATDLFRQFGDDAVETAQRIVTATRLVEEGIGTVGRHEQLLLGPATQLALPPANLELFERLPSVEEMFEAVGRKASEASEEVADFFRISQQASSESMALVPVVSGQLTTIPSAVRESTEQVSQLANSFTKVSQDANSASKEISHLISQTNQFKGNGNFLAPKTTPTRSYTDVIRSVEQIRASLNDCIEPAKRLGSRLSAAFSSKLKSSIKSIGEHIRNIGHRAKGAHGPLGRLWAMIKRIVLVRMIRSAIRAITSAVREGINNLYQWSKAIDGTFAASMDRLATSFLYLKNSLGAMVSPIINALAPAIDFLIDKFVALLNVVNQFFARLTGASVFTKAKKYATSYSDAIGDAGSTAKKAAKEIKDATIGIDELNIISQDDPNTGGRGGGAGADALDYSDMFEEVAIDSEIAEFVDRLKELFNNQDWEGLGTFLGDKFNEVVKKIQWADIGSTIGNGIDAAITVAYSFLHEADFEELGKGLSTFINSGINEIDFHKAGATLGATLTSIVNLGLGFILNLDWGQLAESLSAFVKGFIDELTLWFDKQDWNKVGVSLYNGLRNAINGIDTGGLISSMNSLFGTVFRSAFKLGGGLFSGISIDFSGMFEQIKGANFGETIVNYLKLSVTTAFVSIPTWIYENIIKPFITALVGYDQWDTDFVNFGKSLVEGFFNAIADWWDDLKQQVSDLVDTFLGWWKQFFGIHSPSKKMEDIGSAVVDGFKAGLSLFSGLRTTIIGWKDKVIEWFNGTGAGKLVDKFKTSASEMVEGFKSKIGTAYTTVREKIDTWRSAVTTWFYGSGAYTLYNKFSTYATNAINGFKTTVGNTYTTVQTKITTWRDKIVGWFTGKNENGKTLTENFTEAGKNVVNGFNNGIENNTRYTKSTIQKYGQLIIDKFAQTLEEKSPSRAFKRMGKFAVQGFNNGISTNETSTQTVLNDWSNSILNGFSPNLAYGMSIDTSNVDRFMATDFARDLDTNVTGTTSLVAEGLAEGLETFYRQYVEPTLTAMAEDVRRQADKEEQTVVQIGNRTITDAVTRQRYADGYSFV